MINRTHDKNYSLVSVAFFLLDLEFHSSCKSTFPGTQGEVPQHLDESLPTEKCSGNFLATFESIRPFLNDSET